MKKTDSVDFSIFLTIFVKNRNFCNSGGTPLRREAWHRVRTPFFQKSQKPRDWPSASVFIIAKFWFSAFLGPPIRSNPKKMDNLFNAPRNFPPRFSKSMVLHPFLHLNPIKKNSIAKINRSLGRYPTIFCHFFGPKVGRTPNRCNAKLLSLLHHFLTRVKNEKWITFSMPRRTFLVTFSWFRKFSKTVSNRYRNG